MKKFVLLFLCIIPFLFTSCDKDNEDLRRIENSRFAAYTGHDTLSNEDMFTVYRFYSNTEVERTLRTFSPQGNITSTENGTYTTTEETILINIAGGTVNGTFIDDNAFRVGNLEFIRQ